MMVSELIRESLWYPPRYGGDFAPDVSILLPTYRRCRSGMLARCINSILAQSHSTFELIVVDDASTDGSFDLIQEYRSRDARVGCIRHALNIGLPAVSIYEAYVRSKGAFISFAFDDNEFYPDAIGKLMHECRLPDRHVVYGHVDYFLPDAEGKSDHVVRNFGFGDVSPYTLYSHNFIPNNAVLARRTVFESVGWYDPHIVMARLCDWDLWRRMSQVYEMTAVDVSVGKEFGPTLTDSLGSVYGMDFWSIEEYARMPGRNERLLPANYGSYDVCYIPQSASLRLREVIVETKLLFSDKYWMASGRSSREGQILIVYPTPDASLSFFFEGLADSGCRLRIIQYTGWNWTELIGATAVIFVRDLHGMSPWIQKCRELAIPYYFFLDEDRFRPHRARQDPQPWTDDEQTAALLRGFNGILLGTRTLVTLFSSRSLNGNLQYYPPIAPALDLLQLQKNNEAASGHPVLAFISDVGDWTPFVKYVLPALRKLSGQRSLKLIVTGVAQSQVDDIGNGNIEIVLLPSKLHRSALVAKLHGLGVTILVCPAANPPDEGFQASALIYGAMLCAAVILTSGDPNVFAGEDAYLTCANDVDAWEKCLNAVMRDDVVRSRLLGHNRACCARHFSGAANEQTLDVIMRSHPYAGILLKEERFFKTIGQLRSGRNGFLPEILAVCRQHAKRRLLTIISASRRFTVLSRLYARIRHIPGVWNVVSWLRSGK